MGRTTSALLVLLCVAPSSVPAAATQKGIALGLFAEDAGWSYAPLLDEIAAHGASHVELVVPWYLHDVGATRIYQHPRLTPTRQAIVRTIREAHARHLSILLFPIVRLTHQRNSDEWRGTLKPRNRAAFWQSYRRALLDLAQVAEREHVALLSIGSEMSSLDVDPRAWAPLIADVRRVYHGALTYSGNWDHYRDVAVYDLVDFVGMCAYFPLREAAAPQGPSSTEELDKRWRALRGELETFAAQHKRPLLLTEVGYLSQRGAAAWPWNEGASEPVDLEEQRRCYQSFCRTWQGSNLGGVYFWNWYGWGGPQSGAYTPRNKPAAEEIRRFFR